MCGDMALLKPILPFRCASMSLYISVNVLSVISGFLGHFWHRVCVFSSLPFLQVAVWISCGVRVAGASGIMFIVQVSNDLPWLDYLFCTLLSPTPMPLTIPWSSLDISGPLDVFGVRSGPGVLYALLCLARALETWMWGPFSGRHQKPLHVLHCLSHWAVFGLGEGMVASPTVFRWWWWW